MRVSQLLLVFMTVLGLVAMTAPAAKAALLGIQIEVFVDGYSKGTVLGGAPTLDVNVGAHSTVTFRVSLLGTTGAPTTSWGTSVTADDPLEIDFILNSGVDLSGLNLASNGNISLNDGSPGSGQVTSAFNGTGIALGTNAGLYTIDYFVQPGLNNDAGIDFSVTLTSITATNFGDGPQTDGTQTANVRLNGIPEPATLLLLGSGLAGLAGFGRRKFRK